MSEAACYQKSKEVMLNRSKEYYQNNKEVLRVKTRNKYRELSDEQKIMNMYNEYEYVYEYVYEYNFKKL